MNNELSPTNGGFVDPKEINLLTNNIPNPFQVQAATTNTPSLDANIFDPAKLRLSQDFDAMVGVKKLVTSVPVRKPEGQWFVRTHPEEEYRLPTAVLEDKTDRETFLVDPSLTGELAGEITPILLFTSINRQGVLFLWPVKLPRADGRRNEWNRSAMEAAFLATKRWVRMTSNTTLGAYEVYEATGQLPDPEWPNLSFIKILEVAFRDKFIRSLDHPLIRRLRGQI